MRVKNSKIIGGIVVFIAVIMLMSVSVFAKAGDSVGNSVYSDIVVYINHYAIPSTNYKGDMYVNIQQLKKYGFKTTWDETSKTTILELSGEKTINPVNTYIPAPLNVGKPCWIFDETDVKVCINGNYVEAYGSGGEEILIKVKDLAYLDNVSYEWVEDIKCVKIWVSNGLEMRSTPQYPTIYTGIFPGTWRLNYSRDGETGEETAIPSYVQYGYSYLFQDTDLHFETNHTGYISDISFTWEPVIYADGSIDVCILTPNNGAVLKLCSSGELRWNFDNGSVYWFIKI